MGDRHFAAFGHRIAIEERGSGAEPTVLLVHGLTGDRALLALACDDALERAGLRRLYVDLPGHGHSMGNGAAAGADDLVDALAALLADTGGKRPLLIGYSYGAYLALGLLRDVACGGALLACPVVEADYGKRSRAPRRVARRDPLLRFSDDEHERATFEEVAVLQTSDVLDAYRRVVMPASRAADRGFVDAVRARYAMARPYMEALAHVTAPVSLVCGRDDHWVGFEDAVRLAARALPAASLHVLDGCGHLLPLEQPARFRMLLDDWLVRVSAR